MKMILTSAQTPADYIACLSGWQQAYAAALRSTVRAAVPAAEERQKPGGKCDMARLELHEGTLLLQATVAPLAGEAVAINGSAGTPAQASAVRRESAA